MSPAMKQLQEITAAQLPSMVEQYLQCHSAEVTLILPKGNPLNSHVVKAFAIQAHNGLQIIEGAIYGLSTDDVYEMTTAPGSEFHKRYRTRIAFENALDLLESYLKEMNMKRAGRFTRLLVADGQILEAIDKSLKHSNEYVAGMANKINGNDVLIIDDGSGGRQTASRRVKPILKTISASYAPKSTTVLSLRGSTPLHFQEYRGVEGSGALTRGTTTTLHPMPPAMKNQQEATVAYLPPIVEEYLKAHSDTVTVILPSGNPLTKSIVETMATKASHVEVVNGSVFKLTIAEIEDMVMDRKSAFRKVYSGPGEFSRALGKLRKYLRRMETTRDGVFSRELVGDRKMRDALDQTLKASDDVLAEDANKINGNDVVLIDDSSGSGTDESNLVECILKTISASYAPKSMTVLALHSSRPHEKPMN